MDNSSTEETIRNSKKGLLIDPAEGTGWRSMARDYILLFFLAGTIIVLDQWSKNLVRQNLAIGQTWYPFEWLAPLIRVVHWKNTGAAFGSFQNFGSVIMVLAIVVAGAIIYFFPRIPQEEWTLRLAMGLQLGGAVGNLIDRLTIGWVTDFVAVGNFPVFNVADASISIGVAVLLLGVWFLDQPPKTIDEENMEELGRRENEPKSGHKMNDQPSINRLIVTRQSEPESQLPEENE